jgi:SAM-dependent MidA family methyltransferase
MSLQDIINQEIASQGKITIERYMELCLYHPEYGYYITKDPIGQKGDFITAPEVSALFGEMLGIFIAQILLDNHSTDS